MSNPIRSLFVPIGNLVAAGALVVYRPVAKALAPVVAWEKARVAKIQAEDQRIAASYERDKAYKANLHAELSATVLARYTPETLAAMKAQADKDYDAAKAAAHPILRKLRLVTPPASMVEYTHAFHEAKAYRESAVA